MHTPSTLQSLIAGRWFGQQAHQPLHGALDNALIYHTHADKIDFDEALTWARKTGVPALMRLDFQTRAQAPARSAPPPRASSASNAGSGRGTGASRSSSTRFPRP